VYSTFSNRGTPFAETEYQQLLLSVWRSLVIRKTKHFEKLKNKKIMLFSVWAPCRLVGAKTQKNNIIIIILTVVKTSNLTKSKKSSVLLSWFSGTPYTGTQQNRSDKVHR
jgi:hypothetical protein